MSVRKAASPRSISSQARASETKSSPAPPYSSGIVIPRMPSSAMPSIAPRSRWCAMSFSTAFGRIRSSTNRRTVSWRSRCSSVSSKSTRGAYRGSLLGLGDGFRAPAGGEHAADEDEREAEQHPHRQTLAEKEDAENGGDGRVHVGDDRRSDRADLGDEREEDQER